MSTFKNCSSSLKAYRDRAESDASSKEFLEIQDTLNKQGVSPSGSPPPEGAELATVILLIQSLSTVILILRPPLNLDTIKRKVNILAESRIKYKTRAKELKKRYDLIID